MPDVESFSDIICITLSNGIPGYGKIFSFGKPEAANILHRAVVVQEKIDGSQFSFAWNGDYLMFRSKGQAITPGGIDKMFEAGMQAIIALTSQGQTLKKGYVYRGEYLQKPKHNALAYDRIPKDHVILFDVMTPSGSFLAPEELSVEAARIGLEVVPWSTAILDTPDDLKAHLDGISCLGGALKEGIVIKDYNQSGPFGGPLMVKHVSEAFKEVHRVTWKQSNPGKADIVTFLIDKYRTPGRWQKAINHLRERGELKDDPSDIGPLMGEVAKDVHDECGLEIAEQLFDSFWKAISRGVTKGFPDWYKNKLVEKTFEDIKDGI